MIVEAKDGHAIAEVTCEFTYRADVNYERYSTEFDYREGDIMRFPEQDTATVHDTATGLPDSDLSEAERRRGFSPYVPTIASASFAA